MNHPDVTWGQALKIWWSFAWRSSVLSILVLIPLEVILMFFVFRVMPQPGQKLDPQQAMKLSSSMLLAWPFLMAIIVGLQTAGMRWMIRKAHWSNFRIAILPPNSGN